MFKIIVNGETYGYGKNLYSDRYLSYSSQTVKNANMNHINFYGNNMADSFRYCSNLQSVTNINENVDSMDQLLNGENVKLDFEIRTQETDNELILKSSA